MPFVNDEHRKHPDFAIPGDRCYTEYKGIMDHWRTSQRWTTVDQLAQSLEPNPFKRAYVLAFLVFFIKHVMKYEDKKCLENGDI